ncbi:hypothetical protein ASPWEDRAFT_46645 [Aspergillus wentii DTO 134E9]|uniref:AAA+ ATPase domain-containing protein n=1 Tax=Aspergillus wentii DTO 134E9 TaxID=1073089 RepID=A0A1L9R4S2_ASPWE|nr:uncharacterized protein ASPWEDRAFT_46645 [Aspergillus wentii DTO 134E9]KAI9927167.1 hypothetical protein MW887_003550 [Aspergillus wentii]OJJ29894.1 hypothetical protein ASPWEDRAFT_46645 [Aspergillus wentii DTO 134E9]
MAQIDNETLKEEDKVVPQNTENGTEPSNEKKEENKEEEKPQYAPVGSICDYRNLYETKPDENGDTTFVKEMPKDLPEAGEDEESAQYAVIVRNKKSSDSRKSLELHSIIIQSQVLKEFLEPVMEGYPGVTVSLERLDFGAPFKPFVHRWERFVKAREEATDPTTKDHVELLYKILHDELKDVIARKRDLSSHGVITHDLLWTIFEPDEPIFAVQEGRLRAFKFSYGYMNVCKARYEVTCSYVDHDGDEFGWREDEFYIPRFVGTGPITALPIFPLRYHKQEKSIRESLIARGKLWEAHKGYHYKDYEGPSIEHFERYGEDKEIRATLKGRVIIDAEAYNTFHPDHSVWVSNGIADEDFDDSHRLCANPMVRGYSIKTKKWLSFYLDATKDIVWDTRAFDALVLPREQQNLKQLILAFAKAQSKNADTFDDVVQGKGRGIIMQLSGPPGVGKTLTAESVAEVMQVPLYMMSAGDLGTDAEKVERSLKDILRMVPKWGAVLLLDEADVFMEARDASDLQRNELVSIFLRMLEYYEGILFLTTNRAENIDPAFESRIHVSLAYPDLDSVSRRHIWSQFLGATANTTAFTSEQLDKVAEVQLNGRQIKNIIKTSHLLAWDEEKPLTYEHVQTVLNLRTIGRGQKV